jgi:uncharacterized protein (TIGR02453 family)
MSYFNPQFIYFFEDLAQNNCTSWFAEQKKRFEFEVKKPFEEFIQELILRIALEDASMQTELSDTIIRIKREERVGNFKKPYNEFMAACIGKHGRFDISVPTFYIECSAEGILLKIGVQRFENQALENFRRALIRDFKTLKYIQSRPTFVERFGRIHAERFQSLPDEWKTYAGAVPWLFSKNMTIECRLPAKMLLDPDLGGIIMEHYYAALDFLVFLKQAMQKQQAKAYI